MVYSPYTRVFNIATPSTGDSADKTIVPIAPGEIETVTPEFRFPDSVGAFINPSRPGNDWIIVREGESFTLNNVFGVDGRIKVYQRNSGRSDAVVNQNNFGKYLGDFEIKAGESIAVPPYPGLGDNGFITKIGELPRDALMSIHGPSGDWIPLPEELIRPKAPPDSGPITGPGNGISPGSIGGLMLLAVAAAAIFFLWKGKKALPPLVGGK